MVSAAVEQSRRKANIVAQVDGRVGPLSLTPESLQPKKYLGHSYMPHSLIMQQQGLPRAFKGRLHELKKGLFPAPKMSVLQHTGSKLELKTGPF